MLREAMTEGATLEALASAIATIARLVKTQKALSEGDEATLLTAVRDEALKISGPLLGDLIKDRLPN